MVKAFCAQQSIRIMNLILMSLQILLYGRESRKFSPKRICVYRNGNIGEFFCTLPAFWAIRKKYPDAEITLLSSPGKRGGISAKDVLLDTECVDNIKLYYTDEMADWSGKRAFISRMRRENYDYFIQIPSVGSSFKVQLRNLLFFRLMGFRRASGFYVSISPLFPRAQLFLEHDSEEERCVKHLPFESSKPLDFSYTVPASDCRMVESILAEPIFNGKKPILAVAFAGKWAIKSWPKEYFAEIIERWQREYDGVAVLLGGGKEKEQAEHIRSLLPENCKQRTYNLCDTLAIQQSVLFLKHCKLLLSVDTGTAHMAPLSGVPSIIMQATACYKGQWEPYGDNIRTLRKEQPCTPCFLENCPRSDKYAVCMQEITPQEVWHNIVELVGND